ncbi:hypothetical protein LWE61_17100 [Sphingobium sufflavum]|uniref:GNAT family N-acetyltransferase n=1 Tax=Sphingobium sufflavum TaxID=1129547 RepID=UPI001F17C336|nr:GNAT family N-acetyltransferase [Sphingobium sufflavum]MCE7798257.1 hypothetical protein [Sphingobium sufflavum]
MSGCGGLVAAYNDPQQEFRFALGRACSTVLVAGDAAVKGSVMVGHDGHRGWLCYRASDPQERGTGIGQALVEAGERRLRARHMVKVPLWSAKPTGLSSASMSIWGSSIGRASSWPNG